VLTPVGLTPFTKLPIALSRLIAAPVLSVIVIAAQAGPHTGASPCKTTEPFGSYGIVLGATAYRLRHQQKHLLSLLHRFNPATGRCFLLNHTLESFHSIA
jgi:hypothetical protein